MSDLSGLGVNRQASNGIEETPQSYLVSIVARELLGSQEVFCEIRRNVVIPAGRYTSSERLRYNSLRNRNRKFRSEIPGKESHLMPSCTVFLVSVFFVFFASMASLQAQMPPARKDPLSPAQSSQGKAGCSTTEASSCAEAAAKILPIVMGSSPLEENLRRLTDEVGGRVTGSPEMAKAVEWGVGAFRAAGVDVHTEKYTLPVTWSEGDTRLELLGPVKFPVRLKAEGWSPATPAGGMEANVVDVSYGTDDDFAKAGGLVKGAILLVHSDIGSTWADLFNEYLRPPTILDHALKQGARAILWMGARERLLLYRHTNSLTGEIDRIPQAVVAREDAMRLARTVAAYPGKVRVRFDMPHKIR